MLEPIELLNGHSMVDNTVGDYILQCPDHGIVGTTVFPHQLLQLYGACLCESCGLAISEARARVVQPAQLDRIEAKLDALIEALDADDGADDGPVATLLDGTPIA